MSDETAYAGADWLGQMYRVLGQQRMISSLGHDVAEILAVVWRGLYHLEDEKILGADWANECFIEVKLYSYSTLATFDGDLLTGLVVLCHDRAIRLEVSPCLIRQRAREKVRYFRLADHPGGPPNWETRTRRQTRRVAALCLRFHRRQREGRISQRHPTLEDAAAAWRRGAVRQPWLAGQNTRGTL